MVTIECKVKKWVYCNHNPRQCVYCFKSIGSGMNLPDANPDPSTLARCVSSGKLTPLCLVTSFSVRDNLYLKRLL